MAAGKYRDRVRFERAVAGEKDRYGNAAPGGWACVYEGRGWLRETTGKEEIAAGRLEGTASGTLRVLASQTSGVRAITADDRVVVRGAVWSIKAAPIDPDGAGRQVEFRLERGGAEK